MNRIVEVCCGSYADCIAAWNGGAKRVELNSALSVGGLTPTLSTLIRVKKETGLKVICMSRPRAAGFCYDEADTQTMILDAKLMLENGADGIAFGFLNADRTVCEEATKQMVELVHSYGKEAVYHRAFDMLSDPYAGCETLIKLGVDRILTSGQQAKAMDGIQLIQALNAKYGEQIQFLPGSGMNATNALEMIEKTGVYQVHSSCKNYATDPTTSSTSVTFAYLSEPHTNDYDVVDEQLVKKLVVVVQK